MKNSFWDYFRGYLFLGCLISLWIYSCYMIAYTIKQADQERLLRVKNIPCRCRCCEIDK